MTTIDVDKTKKDAQKSTEELVKSLENEVILHKLTKTYYEDLKQIARDSLTSLKDEIQKELEGKPVEDIMRRVYVGDVPNDFAVGLKIQTDRIEELQNLIDVRLLNDAIQDLSSICEGKWFYGSTKRSVHDTRPRAEGDTYNLMTALKDAAKDISATEKVDKISRVRDLAAAAKMAARSTHSPEGRELSKTYIEIEQKCVSALNGLKGVYAAEITKGVEPPSA